MKNLLPLTIFLLAFSCQWISTEPTLSEFPLTPVAYENYDDAYEADTLHYTNSNMGEGVKIFNVNDTLIVDVYFSQTAGTEDIEMSALCNRDTLILNLSGDFTSLNCATSDYLFRYKFTNWQTQSFYYRVWFNDCWNRFEGFSTEAFVVE